MLRLLRQAVNYAGQLSQRIAKLRQVVTQTLNHRTRSDLLVHPLPQDGVRRFPKVQLGIQLPAQAFDIEQRFLQKNKLRLNFHVKPACSFK